MIAIRRATPVDLLLLIGTMAIWGLAFVAMKIAVPEVGPYWVATARTGFGLLSLLPFCLWRGFQWPRGGRQWQLVLVLVAFNSTIPIILIAWAQLSLSAGVAALLMGTGPFIALFVGHFATTDERFSTLRLLAVMMGFSGVISVVGLEPLAKLDIGLILAEGALILAASMYVVAGYTIRRVDMQPLSLATLSLALATLVLAPVSLFLGGPFPSDVSARAFTWLVFAGVLGTGFGFVMRYYLITRIGYSMFSIGVNLIPVFGVIFGALILAEAVTPEILLALLLIVGGLFVARLAGKGS
ncbi:MAG: DMT family transporter [Rhizobiales bacterium]|nr:DMT family transporter [Hyphomicrobiales bacterium]